MKATGEEAQIKKIVAEVISRLVARWGSPDGRGKLIVVFTGATVGLADAGYQIGLLILGGFQVQLAFTETAERLSGPWLRNHLGCFPRVSDVSSTHWLRELREADMVVVPLLSVNSLSKLCTLTADNLALNLVLHGLFMGKPVVVARDGADPANPGRGKLGFHRGRAVLAQALWEHLKTIEAYGCMLTDVRRLGLGVRSRLTGPEDRAARKPGTAFSERRPVIAHSGTVVTAADVARASRLGAELKIAASCLITPLARDWARQRSLVLTREAG